jgi:hypothetical protein
MIVDFLKSFEIPIAEETNFDLGIPLHKFLCHLSEIFKNSNIFCQLDPIDILESKFLTTVIQVGIVPYYAGLLKVVGNEKRGGSGSKLLIEYGFGPWRSMSV